MSLRYEFLWDHSIIGAVQIKATLDGAEFESTIATGNYGHTSIASVDSNFTDFATALKTEMDADNPGSATVTVTWNGTTGYTLTPSSGTLALNFTTTTVAQGTLMRRILGFDANADTSAAASQSSTMRPYYMVIPAQAGRTNVTDEYEPEGITRESKADDGSVYQLSKSTSEILTDWDQVAEIETAPATFSDQGTQVYKRQADGEGTADDVAWTYQHAFEHHRLGLHPFLCLDGSDSIVYRLRAEGSTFHPVRWASNDFGLWTVAFRAYELGRV